MLYQLSLPASPVVQLYYIYRGACYFGPMMLKPIRGQGGLVVSPSLTSLCPTVLFFYLYSFFPTFSPSFISLLLGEHQTAVGPVINDYES